MIKSYIDTELPRLHWIAQAKERPNSTENLKQEIFNRCQGIFTEIETLQNTDTLRPASSNYCQLPTVQWNTVSSIYMLVSDDERTKEGWQPPKPTSPRLCYQVLCNFNDTAQTQTVLTINPSMNAVVMADGLSRIKTPDALQSVINDLERYQNLAREAASAGVH